MGYYDKYTTERLQQIYDLIISVAEAEGLTLGEFGATREYEEAMCIQEELYQRRQFNK